MFAVEHPDIFKWWYEKSNYLALLSVQSEYQLSILAEKAESLGVKISVFREPDIGNQITAIALEPCQMAKKLCSKLKLALS